ncbi:hypothetical protein AB5J62_06620 [Amycolatopsis sp. cg5]|uniref:hypothetical protein n=1 Tax=Amycolatopsis sp. cg5 TaxID=3238802 RepID=UPI003523EF1B
MTTRRRSWLVLFFLGVVAVAGLHLSACVGHHDAPHEHAAAVVVHLDHCPAEQHKDTSERPSADVVRQQDQPGPVLESPFATTESWIPEYGHGELAAAPSQARTGRRILLDHCVSRT